MVVVVVVVVAVCVVFVVCVRRGYRSRLSYICVWHGHRVVYNRHRACLILFLALMHNGDPRCQLSSGGPYLFDPIILELADGALVTLIGGCTSSISHTYALLCAIVSVAPDTVPQRTS